MNNIYVLNKSYKKIGTLSNQGANPQAPYYEDLYTQELETGADTYQFSTTSSKYTQDILEIGNHIMFAYKNRNELFTITSLEYSHYEGYKTIGVYAEGIGFDLLEVYMKRPENEKDEGGRDEDNDGDTSTDDEYADLDDMYLDENGIIVYDKDGSGPPKEEDMYVDENGIIVYRRNKRNREKDSLEFKNISYSRFLSILLKNTGWSYVCQPGLESVKHDITVRYDTNIFALLQDSMQSYRGVELEFVHELVGGRVQKVIKAYKDGGRGSFVGKRFEYGTNVRGITKMQEVANSEDDTVLYVDNVGIAVQYDVDFALKSAEVPEIEIGDTHYVIDRDFCPPMQIKARIGKIEISFSDPTKNKIYLANNKRISGSAIEDEFGADDVADMLDDYDSDNDYVSDHYHCELVNADNSGEKVGFYGRGFSPDVASSYNLGSETFPWYMLWVDNIQCFHNAHINNVLRATSLDVDDILVRGKITYANGGEGEEGGSGNNGYFDNISVYNQLDTESLIVNTSATVGNLYVRGIEVVFPDGTKCTSSGWDWASSSGDNPGTGGSGGGSTDTPGSGSYGDIIVDSLKIYSSEDDNYVPVRLTNEGIGAKGIVADYEIGTPRLLVSDELPDDASINIPPEIVVRRRRSGDPAELKITPDGITFPDSSTLTSANGLSGEGVTPGTGGGNLDGLIDAVEVDNEYTDTGKDIDLHVRKPTYFDGPIYMTGEWNSWGGASNHFTSIYGVGQLETMIINCDCWRPNDIYKKVTFYGDVIVDGTLTYKDIKPSSDISKKENIRYINNQAVQKENLETRNYSNEDLLEKTDLHDFIINQVNICEYNFIGDTANKIGFIANDYEGTKVGDKIVSKQEFKERNDDGEIIEISESLVYDVDNLLFATIGALQEEVRIKDEKIASLEDRLTKIEAMLGINN